MKFNDTLLRAARKEPVDFVPVWYMRQAGRYDPDYRKIKEKYSLVEITKQPELCAEVTMLPVHKLGVDAAILYSDIMTPLEPMGARFEIVGGRGPVMDHPIRTEEDVEKLRALEPEADLPYVMQTFDILIKELNVPLIGFTGAPFTLASYLIEGAPSKNYIYTKQMMFGRPDLWQKLMDKLGDMVITYIKAQVAHGAKIAQVFDSWVGALAPWDYRTYVFPTMQRIFATLKKEVDVPLIYFGVGAGELLSTWGELDADVIGLDWRITIPDGYHRIGAQKVVQGNLDPTLLMAPFEVVQERAKAVIDQGLDLPGHIFNLGHGLFPQAPIDQLQRLTEFVHEYGAQVKQNK
ncbi:uroporphyrinogen decarboxylase [Rubeoparvulum massiliense]|uniref:uroporphyrinogen decarboxylase n=1 Tax=Rubeoparvulum massiliense TaxID=1631346 RepID=UPI00065E0225|nr:uroporphyrinogen decarboxylase [Rubeoparvulum massiliense]